MLIQLTTIVSPAALTSALNDYLEMLGALAISMKDAKDEPLYQINLTDQPLWQHTILQALFESKTDMQHIAQQIKNHPEFAHLDIRYQTLENKDWVSETQKNFTAQSFGKLWVYPRWEKAADNHQPAIYIEPGLAFGTGTHPTTQLCLTWLATHDLKNKTVIDYGCGSGILALAACALTAKTVWATDHDPQALLSTQNNAEYNVFEKEKLYVVKTDELQNAQADIVIANILANPLIALTPTLITLLKPNGTLVLSGLLETDVEHILHAYQPNFMRYTMQQQAEWVLLCFERSNIIL